MNENTNVGISETLSISGNSKKFIVKTKSSFSNVYLVDAPSRAEAIKIIESGVHSNDFIQKHIGEDVEFIEEANGETDVIQLKPKFINYF